MSIKDQLKSATTIEQIDEVLNEGQTKYTEASDRTKRKWLRVATQRRFTLQNQTK